MAKDKCHQHRRSYKTFNYPGSIPGGKNLLTGVRGVKSRKVKKNKVYISGFYNPAPNQPDQQVKSFVYKGCLCGKGKWYELYYPQTGTQVQVTNLYGPNNGPKKGTIQVVGNYVNNSNVPIGCLYEGPLNGSGKWTSLVPVFPKEQTDVLGVIAHSNMGGLVVGNYDTQIDEGKAFIYDIKKKVYHKIIKSDTLSITAYGIWHNGGNSYTICGGYKPALGVNFSEASYLVDWNNKTKKLSNWKTYHYNNDPVRSRITHFDGITGTKCGYNLTGDWLGVDEGPELAFFASVKRDKCNRKFKRAKWESIKYPLKGNSFNTVTSGNTVYETTVIGVYSTPVSVNGYIAKRK